MNWMDEIEVRDNPPAQPAEHAMVEALRAAARRFAARTDGFAAGKADTCLDIANKLVRYGSFASQKQADFAAKLVEWSKPRESAGPKLAALEFPRLYATMQRLADLRLPGVKLSRKNQTPLVWVLNAREELAGKMESPQYVPFFRRIGRHGQDAIIAAMQAAEADPIAAAVKYGRESGCCAVCGRDLTDPESIARGIGPICAERM
jgi:hypothetical protein